VPALTSTATRRSRLATRPGGGHGWRSLLTGALRLSLGVAATAGPAWCVTQVPRLLAESPRFQLRALEVSGHGTLRGQQVLAASGLGPGDNVFAVDLEQVRRNIQTLPWVRSVWLRRRPPDRLVVRLVERRRVAWVDVGGLYGVDEEGVILPGPREDVDSFAKLDLPVVSGLDCGPDSLGPGARVPDLRLVPLLEWWQCLSSVAPALSRNVSQLQPLGADAVRLRLVGDGLEVRLPRVCAADRVRTLEEVIRRVYREVPEPASIDLRYAGQAVVGRKEPSAPPEHDS
jgi:cell division protein FtsQ